MNNINFFLKYLTGKWLLQNNLFLLTQKKQKKNEQDINFNKNYNNLNDSNQFIKIKNNISYLTSVVGLDPILNFQISGNININYDKKCFFYSECLFKSLLKITKINYKKRIVQHEYIYIVNQNLMINMTLVKSSKGRYLGAKISSYIKKRNKR